MMALSLHFGRTGNQSVTSKRPLFSGKCMQFCDKFHPFCVNQVDPHFLLNQQSAVRGFGQMPPGMFRDTSIPPTLMKLQG
jgi:hypothetical protein